MEPAYPGAVGHYINMGICYDRKGLFPLREQLVELNRDYKACYVRGYQCFRAANEVRHSGQTPFLTKTAEEKMQKRAKGILSREAKKKKGSQGSIKKRFLSGLTCQGRVCYNETIDVLCKKVYELRDHYGLAKHMLKHLMNGMVEAGYHVVACLSPENPNNLEHLLIPELSLAFVTTGYHFSLEKRPYRRIQLNSMVEKEVVQQNRSRLRFSQRISDELIEDGIQELRQAKEFHDDLEELYHPYIDFQKAEKLTDALTREIFDLL